MIRIEIPGREAPYEIEHVLLDYNGTIAVESELGKGTTFTLRIPLNRRRR